METRPKQTPWADVVRKTTHLVLAATKLFEVWDQSAHALLAVVSSLSGFAVDGMRWGRLRAYLTVAAGRTYYCHNWQRYRDQRSGGH